MPTKSFFFLLKVHVVLENDHLFFQGFLYLSGKKNEDAEKKGPSQIHSLRRNRKVSELEN